MMVEAAGPSFKIRRTPPEPPAIKVLEDLHIRPGECVVIVDSDDIAVSPPTARDVEQVGCGR